MITKNFLFVCVENAGRSQMAEAFFKKYAPNTFSVASAGTKPSLQVNPVVADAMKEIGIDIEKNCPKTITKQMIDESSYRINMGCMDKTSCPALFIKDTIDWNISDPKGQDIKNVRKIRDEIESKVKELVERFSGE